MTPDRYGKLPGKARTLVTTSRLWLAEDHILLVKSTRIVEEYRRFYFPDVQAIVIRRTMLFHYGWAIFLFGVALLIGRFSGSATATVGFLIGSAVYLWLRGPACICHLYTAVQKERLPSLHRMKTAERVAGSLRTQIDSHQGVVSSVPEAAATVPPRLPGPPPLPSEERDAPASPLPHFILFLVMLLSATLAGFSLFAPANWARTAVPIASFIEFLTLMPVLMWQTGRRLPHDLKVATWGAVARWMLVQVPAWGLQYKAAIVDKSTRDVSPLAVPLGHGWIGWLNFGSLVLIGITGMYCALAAQRIRLQIIEKSES